MYAQFPHNKKQQKNLHKLFSFYFNVAKLILAVLLTKNPSSKKFKSEKRNTAKQFQVKCTIDVFLMSLQLCIFREFWEKFWGLGDFVLLSVFIREYFIWKRGIDLLKGRRLRKRQREDYEKLKNWEKCAIKKKWERVWKERRQNKRKE